jgi:predicted enzyme related to lactoylglutathione lyase
MNVASLSAISANMGTITAGTIRLPATGTSYIIIDGANNRIDVYEAGVLRVRLGNL